MWLVPSNRLYVALSGEMAFATALLALSFTLGYSLDIQAKDAWIATAKKPF